MTDEKVGFEVARLAKEKGFDVPTLYCFLLDGSEQFSSGDEGDCALYNHNLWDYYSRPTQSLLARWLREVHNIHIETLLSWGLSYFFKIYKGIEDKYTTDDCSSLEEGLEIALLEALKLIK